MKITQVRVSKWEKDKIKGFATITLDGCFVVGGLKIMQGSNGLFVAMPSQKKGEEYKDICFPITKEFRQELQSAVLEKFGFGDDLADDVASATGGKVVEDSEEFPFK